MGRRSTRRTSSAKPGPAFCGPVFWGFGALKAAGAGFCLLLVGLPLAGCGPGGPPLGTVSGTVTLDGKALPDALVEFQPEGQGSPSTGTTDQQGRYELLYAPGRPGAMLGKHRVTITTYRQESTDSGQAIEIPERVPPWYNDQTTLVREVEAGEQTIDFPLSTTPPKAR
jgi:hypothetical protein